MRTFQTRTYNRTGRLIETLEYFSTGSLFMTLTIFKEHTHTKFDTCVCFTTNKLKLKKSPIKVTHIQLKQFYTFPYKKNFNKKSPLKVTYIQLKQYKKTDTFWIKSKTYQSIINLLNYESFSWTMQYLIIAPKIHLLFWKILMSIF